MHQFTSPVKKSFVSPNKPMGSKGRSQRRRQRQDSDDIDQKYLSTQFDDPENQKLSCKLSPVKRMKRLEQQEKNTENIETAYKQSPTKFVINPNQTQPEEVEEEAQPKSLLEQTKEAQEPQLTQFQEEQEEVVPISEIIDVDSNVINYGQFICGKILGSTLLLSNISEEDQIVTMSISNKQVFNCDEIFGPYNRDELPFDYKDGTTIKNSEVEFNCWFIENPVSKELQKAITLKIGPGMSQEFIVVVKAPKNRLESKIVSFIDIQMTEDQYQTGKAEKHLTKGAKGEVQLKEVHPQRKMDVLLLGYLDNPKIKCIKQLFNQQTNSQIIPLVVKKTQGVQKFKLPFRNLSQYLDGDIEFAFIRTQNQNGAGQNSLMEPIDCLSFYCQPNQLKIHAESVAVLGVQVKVNSDMLADGSRVNQENMRKPQNKLLVARLKNS